MLTVTSVPVTAEARCRCITSEITSFPSFLPKQVHKIKDPLARNLAARIERLSVSLNEQRIMSSCVKPLKQQSNLSPVVLLHGFDSSCLEWRYTYPLLEEAGLEPWAVDILGWGFSDLETRPACDVASKRLHLYEFWKSHVKKPMILVGPSLGAAVAIDFAVNFPEAVEKLVLIDASVYAEGTGGLASLPKLVAYLGVSLLKSVPLRLYANFLCFTEISFGTALDWMNVISLGDRKFLLSGTELELQYITIGRLHCLLPWWEDMTVDFMRSGGYRVIDQIKQVRQRTLIIWGEEDQIIPNELATRLQSELPNAIIQKIPNCGHIPHVENPSSAAKLIIEFSQQEVQSIIS